MYSAVQSCNEFCAKLDLISFDVMVCKKVAHRYTNTERRVPQLIPVLGSQPAGEVSHKLGDRLPLLSARAATNFAAW